LPALPISFITGLLLLFFLLRAWLGGRTHPMLLILLAACSAQSILIDLHQFYQLSWLRPVQPVTAAMLPSLSYLAFVSSTQRRLLWHCDLWHVLPVGFVVFCVLLFPQALDTAIPAVFLIYGTALLHSLHQGGDSLIFTQLDSDNIPLRLWQFIATALLVSSLGEIVINLAHASGHGTWQPMILSALSSLTLLALGALALSPHLHLENDAKETTLDAPIQPSEAATKLVARLQTLLKNDPLFLDPDLTLSRLARRPQVPVKELSKAINQLCGENVSRFVNRHRIAHACGLLKQGHSVTGAMFDSGFQTKSNFNREFLRLKGCTSQIWLGRNQQD
jgi:AraC-like DNA-binding protein